MRPITPDEWKVALQYLADAPDGTKLPYSWMPDNTSRKKFPHLYDCYETYHSFIKVNGVIYGLAQGKDPMSILDAGSFGKVKFAQNQLNEHWLVKIGRQKDIKNEPRIYLDLALSKGYSINPLSEKFFLVMPNLGVKLANILDEKDVDVNRRMRIGINLCLEVHALHYGLKSESHIPYIHWDLTPNNITVKGDSTVSLIDYGFSKVLTGTKAEHHWGTYMYRPLITRMITDEQAEIEYLLHNLYLPTQYPAYNTRYSASYQNIYTHGMLANHELLSVLDTSSISRPNHQAIVDCKYTALNLAAIQIASYYELAIDFKRLVEDRVLSLLVITLYQRGHDAQIMKEMLSNYKDTLISLYPQAQGCQHKASLLLINDVLHLGENAESLANNPDALTLIQILDRENMLRHYRVIQAIPGIKAVFLNSENNIELFSAAKSLLLAGSYQIDYISARWDEIIATPDLEASISLRREQMYFILHEKYSEDYSEVVNSLDPDLFLRLHDYMDPFDIEFISQSIRLKRIILSDSVCSHFFNRLVSHLKYFNQADANDIEDDEALMRLEFAGLLYQRGLVELYMLALHADSTVISLVMLMDSKLGDCSNQVFNILLKKISELSDYSLIETLWLDPLDDTRFTQGLLSITKPKIMNAWIDFWQNYYQLKQDLTQKSFSLIQSILFEKIDELINEDLDFFCNQNIISELKELLENILTQESFPLDIHITIQDRISGMLEQIEIMQMKQTSSHVSAIGLFKSKECEPDSSVASIKLQN